MAHFEQPAVIGVKRFSGVGDREVALWLWSPPDPAEPEKLFLGRAEVAPPHARLGNKQAARATGPALLLDSQDTLAELRQSGLKVGKRHDRGRGRLFVDSSGAVYAEGVTASADFPTKQAFQARLKGAEDGVVFKLAPDGKSLIYSTFLGGTDTRGDAATGGLVVNAAGEAFVCGFTTAPDFPTTVGAFQRTLSGMQDAFLVRLSADGSTLLASTLLGGSGDEAGHSVALDSAGNPIILGTTTSSDFPTTASAYQRVLRGPTDFTITKMPADLSSAIFSTYVGGSGREDADTAGIVLDANDNIYFTGGTASIDFPVTSNAIQASYGGGTHDVCVVKLSATGAQILYATYLGGSGDDFARSIRYKKN